MNAVAELLARAVESHRAGRLDEAEQGYRAVLAVAPGQADALHLLGLIARRKGDPAAAATLITAALDLSPDMAEAHSNLGNVLCDLGQVEAAVARYRRAIALNPGFTDAHVNLATALQALGRDTEAAESYATALAITPTLAEAHLGLGHLHRSAGRFAEAAACFAEAVRHRPDFAEAQDALGVMLQRLGQLPAAAEAHRRAVALRPAAAVAHNNLGTALQRQRHFDAAAESYRQAIALKPDYVEAMSNLGSVLQAQRRFDEAVAVLERALALAPDHAEALCNLGVAQQRFGHLDAACASFRRALELRPDYSEAHSNLIFALDFDPDLDTAAQQAERRRWYQAHAAGLDRDAPPHRNDRTAERKLRVGYVSADFLAHSAAFAFAPVLLNHDPARVEFVCYSGALLEDAWSERFRAAARLWRPVAGLSDAELAARIRQDRIDILVDLSGHSSGNRLLVFARKPAPVQVTAWGHANGTGLPQVDYLFADPVLVPQNETSLFAESLWYLPSAFSFSAGDDLPAVAPLPAAISGQVTFGCFNRLAKLTPASIAAFATVLQAVPGARLLLKTRELDDATARDEVAARFAGQGIAAQRLVLLGASDRRGHLAAYGAVDIALDPLPHGGGITTLEALWMGVPTVALRGRAPSHRMAAAILTAAGLEDFVAGDAQGYRHVAAHWAARPDALAALRGGMRDRLATLPLGNGPTYAGAVEAAYRDMWRRWCGV